MKVVCALTHSSKNAAAALNGFAEGVKKSGDEVEIIKSKGDLYKLSGCIASIQVGYHTIHMLDDLRWALHKWATKTFRSQIFLEPAIFSQINNRYDDNDLNHRHYMVCLNGIKRDGIWIKNCSPNRWNYLKEQHNIQENPWSWEPEKPILILGQNEKGTSVQNVDVIALHEYTISQIKLWYPNNEIYYLPHPSQHRLPKNYIENHVKIKECRSSEELNTAIMESFFVCTYTTSAAVDAVLCGKPILGLSPNNVIAEYGIGVQNLSELNDDYVNDGRRANFLADAAMWNWSIEEMENGECWKEIRNVVC